VLLGNLSRETSAIDAFNIYYHWQYQALGPDELMIVIRKLDRFSAWLQANAFQLVT